MWSTLSFEGPTVLILDRQNKHSRSFERQGWSHCCGSVESLFLSAVISTFLCYLFKVSHKALKGKISRYAAVYWGTLEEIVHREGRAERTNLLQLGWHGSGVSCGPDLRLCHLLKAYARALIEWCFEQLLVRPCWLSLLMPRDCSAGSTTYRNLSSRAQPNLFISLLYCFHLMI